MEERKRLTLTGLMLLTIVLMFLPWFGKGELNILGVEVLLNPLTVAGVMIFMLGLWWRPRYQRLASLLGSSAVLAGELYTFFFWPSTPFGWPDLGFSLRFARPGFYLGIFSTLVLVSGCLLCQRAEQKAEKKRQKEGQAEVR